jgi:hypothetical protein
LLVAAVGLAAGCCDPGPPFSCAWSGTPRGLSAGDLVGDYAASQSPGQTLSLDEDGTFTTSGFTYRDWLNGYELRFEAGDGVWEAVADDGSGVPFIDVPFVEDTSQVQTVVLHGDAGGSVELETGGTREAPVLYHHVPSDTDTCDAYSSLFRTR